MSKKLTNHDVLEVIQQFSYQDDNKIVFGFVANKDNADNNVSIFMKGEGEDIITLLVMQMMRDKDFKEIINIASACFKHMNGYENQHPNDN